jgi:ComEC/Rec2-related protein
MMLDKHLVPLPPLHPLIFITSALIAGICWQATYCPPTLALFLGLFLWYSINKTSGHRQARLLMLGAVCLSFCAGSFLWDVQTQRFAEWLQKHREPVNALVTITDISSCSTKNYNVTVTAQLKSVQDNGEWQTTPYNVVFYARQKPDFAVYDTVLVPQVTLSKPRKKTDHTYALKNNIGATVFCEKIDYISLTRPITSARRWLWHYRQHFTETLYAKMSTATASFYSLLFMGTYYPDKKKSEALRTPFQIWGILHYLARSGLHLVVFIMIWNLVLLAVPCRPRTRELILLLLCSTYFVLSWPTLSFVRAFTTYLVYKISTFTHRPAHTLYTITLITFLFLVANPTHLFCLDFQLSFGLTYALAWVQHSNFSWKNFLAES